MICQLHVPVALLPGKSPPFPLNKGQMRQKNSLEPIEEGKIPFSEGNWSKIPLLLAPNLR
jgi:energy-converting hydrogenase Eha subunit F